MALITKIHNMRCAFSVRLIEMTQQLDWSHYFFLCIWDANIAIHVKLLQAEKHLKNDPLQVLTVQRKPDIATSFHIHYCPKIIKIHQ